MQHHVFHTARHSERIVTYATQSFHKRIRFYSPTTAQTETQQLHCTVCDSRANPNCVFNPQVIPRTPCAATVNGGNFATCRTRIVAPSGATLRECASNPDLANVPCTDANTCVTCTNLATHTTLSCNAATTFPANRLSCVQCEGSLNSTCAPEQDSAVARLCRLTDTRCFTRRSNRLVTRGCASDHRGLCTNEAQCLFCNTPNCNLLSNLDRAIPEASNAAVFTVAPVAIFAIIVAVVLQS